jgi:hypothetical protein
MFPFVTRADTMTFPDFFAAAPVIRLRDPLAAFLGAAEDGLIDYRYEDAVRLAGHSCPTVASAFLMTRKALTALYGDAPPVRGEIRVDLAEARDAGVAGVIASIATLVTGATADSGFRGLGGQFNRRDRLFFAQSLEQGTLRFTRVDTGAAVEVAADLSGVPGDPRIGELMPPCLSGLATAAQQREFQSLWQDRVRRLLLDHADDADVIRIYR